ncbi:DUF1643 domain-containing protein [Streptomyces californicus]|uniref:DUF1643 domain-containing protein n=1 Tax=Streptomyces californicus TaxID=67351 RepID=UPI0036495634
MTIPEQITAWAAEHGLVHHEHPGATATFGPGYAHRYTLTRTWEPGGTYAAFVLLNPSTATAAQDDATVRRLIGYAKREGHGGLVLGNLFAERCRDPYALMHRVDIIGPANDQVLGFLAETVPDITVGWGTWGRLPRARAVEALLTAHGARLWSLGTTQAGHPRHPLYLAKNAPLTRYTPGSVR